MELTKFNPRSYLTHMWLSHRTWVDYPLRRTNLEKSRFWCLKNKYSDQAKFLPMKTSIRMEGPEVYSFTMLEVSMFYEAGFIKGTGHAFLKTVPEKKKFVTPWMWGFNENSLEEAFESGVAAGEAALRVESSLSNRIRRAFSIF